MPNTDQKRYYAMAVNDTGKSIEICRIPEPSEDAARAEHARAFCDPVWFAEGFYVAENLAIETREKRGGEWTTTETKTFPRGAK